MMKLKKKTNKQELFKKLERYIEHALENSNLKGNILTGSMFLTITNANQFHKHLLNTYLPWGHNDQLC